MLTNPYLNAVLASLYIVAVVSLISSFKWFDMPENFFAPIIMISLLVFSVSTMGFLFFFRPLQMYLDGQKQEAVTFFFKTLGTFAVLTVFVVTVALVVG